MIFVFPAPLFIMRFFSKFVLFSIWWNASILLCCWERFYLIFYALLPKASIFFPSCISCQFSFACSAFSYITILSLFLQVFHWSLSNSCIFFCCCDWCQNLTHVLFAHGQKIASFMSCYNNQEMKYNCILDNL